MTIKKRSISKKMIEEIQQVTDLSINKLSKKANVTRSTLANIMADYKQELTLPNALKLLKFIGENYSREQYDRIILNTLIELAKNE